MLASSNSPPPSRRWYASVLHTNKHAIVNNGGPLIPPREI